MRNAVIILSLTVALLVGCSVGAVGSNLVIPPVRAGTSPAKWEYKCFKEHSPGDIEAESNRLGAAGFELASTGNYHERMSTWCFKRRLP